MSVNPSALPDLPGWNKSSDGTVNEFNDGIIPTRPNSEIEEVILNDTNLHPLEVEGIEQDFHLTEPFALLKFEQVHNEQDDTASIANVSAEANLLNNEAGLENLLEHLRVAVAMIEHSLEEAQNAQG